ncbi:glycosyltransferase [Kamptonema cortianum]|nr:glycosyltransferase [Oscillatoria laete-virens]MDK3159645.1 glycosyltransferase [Kamptonema cortianum]MDL5050291.1 glycosyltransferase [Oscillatoria amoena NRMC-F 0135]MDL5055124.1 glycosyltransferase [Oscillatoria laete-virens NRMC-F 0139]
MKICDLTQFYSPDSGGVKRYLTEKIAYIAGATDHEHVLIIPGPTSGMTQNGRCRTYTIRSPRVTPTSRYRIMLKMSELHEILEKEKPDLIELGDPYHVAWSALKFARPRGIPVVGFYHSNFPEAYVRTFMRFFGGAIAHASERYAQSYVKKLYNQMSATFVPSPGLHSLLTSWGVERVYDVDLGVDTRTFSPERSKRDPLRHSLGLSPKSKLLLYVTRLSKEKNVQTLLKAFELLVSAHDTHMSIPPPPVTQGVGAQPIQPVIRDAAPSGSPYHLMIVGDGPLRKEVAATARKTKALTHRHYIADKAELATLYASADLFVHPGVLETFGLAALESQCSGTPVCGIRGSRLDRIIFSGLNYWASMNSPENLANAIQQMCLLDLPSMGLEARQGVIARYDWPSVFGRHFELYSRFVQK